MTTPTYTLSHPSTGHYDKMRCFAKLYMTTSAASIIIGGLGSYCSSSPALAIASGIGGVYAGIFGHDLYKQANNAERFYNQKSVQPHVTNQLNPTELSQAVERGTLVFGFKAPDSAFLEEPPSKYKV